VRRALLAVVAAGCIQPLEPQVGPPLRASCANEVHDPSHDKSFASDINPIIDEYHCRNCHTPTGMTPIGVEVSGLDLTSYNTLMVGGVRSGAQIVVAGQPCQSILLQKLSEGPPYGARMPLDGPPYLGDDDLDVLSDWILEGAHDN
jgi:hypothetical protein